MQANDNNTKGTNEMANYCIILNGEIMRDINGQTIEGSREVVEKWCDALRRDGHHAAPQYLG